MARRYTDEDRAAVYFALTVNQGNIARTSRDTRIPEATVRDWRNAWDRDGVPSEVLSATEQVATDYLNDAERVRDKSLAELERMIDAQEVKPAQLVATFGVLEDKIRLGKGLATSRSETVHAMPDPDEMGKAVAEVMLQALKDTDKRSADINEAEGARIIPEKELSTPDGG